MKINELLINEQMMMKTHPWPCSLASSTLSLSSLPTLVALPLQTAFLIFYPTPQHLEEETKKNIKKNSKFSIQYDDDCKKDVVGIGGNRAVGEMVLQMVVL